MAEDAAEVGLEARPLLGTEGDVRERGEPRGVGFVDEIAHRDLITSMPARAIQKMGVAYERMVRATRRAGDVSPERC